MYASVVLLLMLALPVVSIAIESATTHAPLSLSMVGRWFVFWCVGARLLLAGLRQIIQPNFTARVIFRLDSKESQVVVRELGFANTAIGLVGLGSVLWKSWAPAGALAGTVFYLLAGLNHLGQRNRSTPQSIALISDLFAAAVLAVSFGALAGLPL
jgi:hypothetical protein